LNDPADTIAPATSTPPVLSITTFPPDSEIALILNGANVLVNARFPLVELVALKAPIVFAPFMVSPVTEFVVNKPVVLIKPEPLSVIAPDVSVRLTAPPPVVAIMPVMLIPPVLLTVILPPPVLLIPVIISGFVVLVSAISPLVLLVALIEPIVLAPFRVVPPVELVVNKPVVLMLPLPASEINPALLKVRLLVPPLNSEFSVKLPDVVVRVALVVNVTGPFHVWLPAEVILPFSE